MYLPCNIRRTIFHLPSAKRRYVFSFQYASPDTPEFSVRILTASDTLKCGFVRRNPIENRSGNAEPFLLSNLLAYLRNNTTEKPETFFANQRFN